MMIFLLFFIPIAYFGSQYLMESGQWSNITDRIENIGVPSTDDTDTKAETNNYNRSDIEKKLEQLLQKIEEQNTTIKEQEITIHKQNVLIDQLRQQLNGQHPPSSTGETSIEQQSVPINNSDDSTPLEELLKEADKVIKDN